MLGAEREKSEDWKTAVDAHFVETSLADAVTVCVREGMARSDDTFKKMTPLLEDVEGIIMKEKSAATIGGEPRRQSGFDLSVRTHLGRKLRELFDGPPEPLPQRLLELLDQLAAKDTSHPPVNKQLKALLSMIPILRAFAFSLCGNHDRADDLVQETLLKAWSHVDSFQEGTNLRAWLFTILRNSYFSEMRKRRREVEDVDGKKAESLSIAPAQQGHLDLQDVRKALDMMPPDQREALVLVGGAGMTYEEAAQIARCAVGTMKSRVNRSRAKLASLLGIEDPDAFGPDSPLR
jgi:RNA polymerase sigma-70 factor, ECF subfamily